MDNSDEQTALNLTHLIRPALERDNSGAAPALLLLHGRGADEEDLMGLEGALDPRFTVISVRAPFRLGPGYAWYDMAQLGSPDDETLNESLQELREFVTELPAAHGVDSARLYLMGFSQGAIVSSALAMLVPQAVRGVVMHSGYVPTLHSGLDLTADGLAGKPFFVAHGKYDDVIPVTYGRDAQEFLEAADAAVTYREYPIGHSISEESLYDISEWLTAQLDNA
jgi:phospholipase/carboxylesterase